MNIAQAMKLYDYAMKQVLEEQAHERAGYTCNAVLREELDDITVGGIEQPEQPEPVKPKEPTKPDVEQPKAHVGDSGIRAHSCGELFPHVVVYKGKTENLKRYINIAGNLFLCPNMPTSELKVWADAVQKELKAGKFKQKITTSELGRPILVENLKQLGYAQSIVELAATRAKEVRGYYDVSGTATLVDLFGWAKTPEGGDFWVNVNDKRIKDLDAYGLHFPIDPRIVAALYSLQFKRIGKFNRDGLIEPDGSLYVQNVEESGIDLCTHGLLLPLSAIWYTPSETFAQSATDAFLDLIYEALNQ